MNNPIEHFYLTKESFGFIDCKAARPECVVAKSDSHLFLADVRGGVLQVNTKTEQYHLITDKNFDLTKSPTKAMLLADADDVPNGICLDEDDNVLIANIGSNCLEKMTQTGKRNIVYDHIDGRRIGKIDFVTQDSQGRTWVTIATDNPSVLDAWNPDDADGYIAVIDKKGIRIVAEGFQFTNEIKFDRNEEFLYISETTGRHISRMRVSKNAELSNREIFGPSDLGPAGFPDGITLDSYGNVWGTMIFGEKIFAITPEGDLKIIFDDGNDQVRAKIDRAFFAREPMTTDLLFSGVSSIAPAMTSLAFAGEDLQTVYVGNLMGDKLPYFRSPVSGLAMPWWG